MPAGVFAATATIAAAVAVVLGGIGSRSRDRQ